MGSCGRFDGDRDGKEQWVVGLSTGVWCSGSRRGDRQWNNSSARMALLMQAYLGGRVAQASFHAVGTNVREAWFNVDRRVPVAMKTS